MLNSIFLSCLWAALPSIAFILTCAALIETTNNSSKNCIICAVFALLSIIAQVALLLSGESLTLLFTLLPLTVCLPAVLCVHLISANTFFQTCAVWMMGSLAVFAMSFSKRLLFFLQSRGNPPQLEFPGLLVALLVLFLWCTAMFRFLRQPFQEYVRAADTGWPALLPPTLMSLAVLSYFSSSTSKSDPVMLVLACITALSMILVLARLLWMTVSLRRVRETEFAAQHQLSLQQRDYDTLRRKLELGRAYRHDMRHHLVVLDHMLQQGDSHAALDYIRGLSGKLSETEETVWCQNAALNAVLAHYISKAQESGCRVEASVSLPEKPPFDVLDLCSVLANTLENAVHACQKLPGNQREIFFSAKAGAAGQITVNVENPCLGSVELGPDDLPVPDDPNGEHGVGLRSVLSIVNKYHGLLHCSCSDDRFVLQAVLFSQASEGSFAKAVSHRFGSLQAALAGALLCFLLLNLVPSFSNAVERIPVLGDAASLFNLRRYHLNWGDTEIDASQATLDGADELNKETEAFMTAMEEKFLWYVSRKYEGYVGLDMDYTVLRDDEALLILRYDATINVGGSVNYTRHFILDRSSGQILTLADLFLPDINYVSMLSREIQAQMHEQVNAGSAFYYLPGSGWAEEDCFRAIDPEQDFYLNEEGQLVIVFDEYAVAPGSMGMPEFVIPSDLLFGMLAEPSLIK